MKKHAHFALLRPLSIFLLFSLGITLQLTAQQTEVYTISHDNTRIRDMVFGQNGKALVVKSGDEVLVNAKGLVTSPSIHVWDMDGRRKTMAIADREYGRASCISHDGSMVAFREKGNINVMDLASKKVISTVKFDETKFTRPIAFCNEKHGLVVEQGNRCMVYDIQTETARYVREYSAPGLAHYVTKDDAFALETFGDSFRIMDFKQGMILKEIPLIERGKVEALRSLIVSPEARFVATLSDNKVRMWDLASYKLAHQFSLTWSKDAIFCFSADGRYLIGGLDTMKMWELRTKKEIITPIIAEGKISAIAASADGKYLACGDTRGNIKVWEFSDENMSAAYFSREIDNEIRQMPPKKEFEKTDDFAKRRQKLIRSIYSKYLTQYVEKTTTETTIQETWAEEDERREDDKKATIASSRVQIEFRIDSIMAYNADRESFQVKLVNDKERYAKWETIKVPLRDNAQCFKQRAATLTVIGTKQLSEDLRSYEIYNIKIKSNCSGKDKDYAFGQQRKYLDE